MLISTAGTPHHSQHEPGHEPGHGDAEEMLAESKTIGMHAPAPLAPRLLSKRRFTDPELSEASQKLCNVGRTDFLPTVRR